MRNFPVAHRPLHQEPGRHLHQPRGQAHAFSGIGQRRRAREPLGGGAAGAVEVSGAFLDQRHALLEGALEQPPIWRNPWLCLALKSLLMREGWVLSVMCQASQEPGRGARLNAAGRQTPNPQPPAGRAWRRWPARKRDFALETFNASPPIHRSRRFSSCASSVTGFLTGGAKGSSSSIGLTSGLQPSPE